ncbi:Mu transposase C-terminal domain-containing protein [Orrella marina]|uniref:Integrase catalytic domain-containing protein n=1 Tax=Orrella marina TaxID=2163011 RepID=A0A2R4XLN7_9BURK|nr:Mu transposase C-terminal domain-containing protein [Orrella marina]AWB34710.1 hypothetical protein DBV39_14390 [Orrella marina]
MIRYTYKRGLVFIQGQTRWQLERLLVTNKYQLISGEGEHLEITRSEIDSKWLAGEWVIDEASIGSLSKATYMVAPRDLSTFTDYEQRTARYRYGYLKAVDPSVNRFNRERWGSLISEHAEKTVDKRPPCVASVQNWWRQYRNTKSINALIPKRKGRRRPIECPRHSIFLEVIEEVYLNKQRLPAQLVFERVDHRIRNVNDGSPEKIKPVSRSTVYEWLKELNQQMVDVERLGAKQAGLKYRAALFHVKTKEVNERWEIDHTPLDLHVFDSVTNLVLGRAWITLVIDCATRMIMGFYISFGAPSAHSVNQAIRCAILPKNQWLERFKQVTGNWPAQGLPTLVAVDNGMDLHAASVEAFCEDTGIETLFCPAGGPEFKAVIERFMRTSGQGLIHRLPGTTFSNPRERGDYPSELESCITLTDLTQLLVKWIVDVYHIKHHRTLKNSPIREWAKLAERAIIEMPAYPESLAILAAQKAERTVFHYGIELEGLFYHSPELNALREKLGKNPKVQLKFDEDQIAYVHVFDEQAACYLKVPAKDQEYAVGRNRPMHRLIREYARKTFGENHSIRELYEAEEAIREMVANSIVSKKTAHRKKAARTVMHDSEAVLRKENPIDDALNPVPEERRTPLPDPLPDGLDDDLPDLDVFGTEGK